jgi:hypothetical protein
VEGSVVAASAQPDDGLDLGHAGADAGLVVADAQEHHVNGLPLDDHLALLHARDRSRRWLAGVVVCVSTLAGSAGATLPAGRVADRRGRALRSAAAGEQDAGGEGDDHEHGQREAEDWSAHDASLGRMASSGRCSGSTVAAGVHASAGRLPPRSIA